MHKFKKAWTYRSPTETVDFEAGWEGPLRPERLKAAKEAEVLEEEAHGNDVEADEARPPRRSSRSKAE